MCIEFWWNYYYNKIKEAVNETKGKVLTYNDEVIEAFYFAMSNGYTENASLVFNEDKDYLQSVTSIYEITINEKVFKGTEVRKLLNIRSTDFEIKINNNQIEVVTKGYGHGVGMSQYGANGMAKEGKNYEEILTYFYKNVKLSSI